MQECVTLVLKNQLDPWESFALYMTSPIRRKAAKEKKKQVYVTNSINKGTLTHQG